MKSKKMFQVLAMAVALIFIGAAGVMAASVTPTLVDPWSSAGDAAGECSRTDCAAGFSYKFDDWGEDLFPDGPYKVDGGNTITIDNADEYTFDWSSEYPVCAVIVKASTAAYIYYYDGGAYDTGLVAPEGKEISHVTFCYNPPDNMCYEGETAWAKGLRYVTKGNWAMYVPYAGVEKTVDIIAGGGTGGGLIIGTATFEPTGDYVKISITLTGGAIFYYDLNDPLYDNNLKVQDYAKAPTKTPSPGLFAWKVRIEPGATTGSIVVPENNFYGVHLDVAVPVDCE